MYRKDLAHPDCPARSSHIRSGTNWNRRKGIGTLEVVIIIAVLLSIALIFRQALTAYATDLIDTVFNDQNVIDELAVN